MRVRTVLGAFVGALALAVPATAAGAPVEAPTVEQGADVMTAADARWTVTLPDEGWVRVQYAHDQDFGSPVCDTGWFLSGFHTTGSWGPGEAIWFAEACAAPAEPGAYHWRARYGPGTSYDGPEEVSDWSEALAFELVPAPEPPPPPAPAPGPGPGPAEGEELDPEDLEALLAAPPEPVELPEEPEWEPAEPICAGDDPDSDDDEAAAELAVHRALADATRLGPGLVDEDDLVSRYAGFEGCTEPTPAGARCGWVKWHPALAYKARVRWLVWTLYKFSVMNHACFHGGRVYEVFGTEWTWDRLTWGIYNVVERSHGNRGFPLTWNGRANGAYWMEHRAHLEFCVVTRSVACTVDYWPRVTVTIRGNRTAVRQIIRYR